MTSQSNPTARSVERFLRVIGKQVHIRPAIRTSLAAIQSKVWAQTENCLNLPRWPRSEKVIDLAVRGRIEVNLQALDDEVWSVPADGQALQPVEHHLRKTGLVSIEVTILD